MLTEIVMQEALEHLNHQLVVSCQAGPEEPLHGPGFMAVMARTAAEGGAAGIRTSGPADIAAICAAGELPLIGTYKQRHSGAEDRFANLNQVAMAFSLGVFAVVISSANTHSQESTRRFVSALSAKVTSRQA